MAAGMNDTLKGGSAGAKSGSSRSKKRGEFDDKILELSQTSNLYTSLLGDFKKFEEMRNQIAKESRKKRLEEELADENLSAERRTELQEQLAAEEARIEQRALEATRAFRENEYKYASAARKAELAKEHADNLAEERKFLHKRFIERMSDENLTAEQRAELQKKYMEDDAKYLKAQREAREQQRKLEESASNSLSKKLGKAIDNFKKDKSFKNGVELAVNVSKLNVDSLKEMVKESEKKYDEAKNRTAEAEKEIERLRDLGVDENSEDMQRALAEHKAALKAENEAATEKAINKTLEKVAEAVDKAFEEVESMITQYKGHIDARLQGSDKSYNSIVDKVSTILSISPFVKTQKMIENVKELVDKGVAYNVEERAFLQTVSDKIANTFDAFDANLLRLIRLQQADSTKLRLGMEASLTKFLNNMFEDTSYLSDVYDSVSSALIDANATMTRNMSAKFEYIVQKWLGALSSVGMSSDTINQIATGINYLATGDVQSLASNTQLQTLIAMSASNAGLSYSDLLLNGLDASTTNKLLESMVSYLKQIAEGADNQVVRAAYGDIFKMSMSDMKAVSNLSMGDIQNIGGTTLSTLGMGLELQNQFLHLITRTSISEMIDNVYNNAVFGVAEDLMSDPVTYSMYKMLHYMREQEVDWKIPFVNIFGSGVNLNTSVGEIMNGGLQLAGAASLALNILSGIGSVSGGGLNLSVWGGKEYTSRGSGMTFSTGAVQGGTSGSTYVASGSGTDMKNSTINSATDDAEETAEITNKNAKSEYTFDDFYKVTVAGSEGSGYIRTFDSNLAVVFGTESLRIDDKLKVYDYHLDDYKYADHVLNTYDLALDKYRYTTGGTNKLSVVDDSLKGTFDRFKFTAKNSELRVSDSDTHEAIQSIYCALSDLKKTKIPVSLTNDTTVKIDKDTLVMAFKEAMGHKEGKSRDVNYKTISDLYRLLAGTAEDDRAHVRVQNEDGYRLQVDTETGGVALYDAGSSHLKW